MISAITTTPDLASAEALARACESLDPVAVGRFEIEDGSGLHEVGVHFAGPPDEVALMLLAAAHGARPWTVSEVPDVDWVAKVRRDLPPVVAGRFVVHGSHDAGSLPPGVPLLVEASMAFGTGHHGTTLGCLRALDRLESEGFRPARAADIGAGTAVLAMAAARLWPEAAVTASDIDPVAVEVAAANLAANALGGRVALLEAAGLDHPGLAGPFDLLVANILKGPLLSLADDVARAAAPGGAVILSGILNEQADDVANHYRARGIIESDRERIGDWTTLVLRRNGSNPPVSSG